MVERAKGPSQRGQDSGVQLIRQVNKRSLVPVHIWILTFGNYFGEQRSKRSCSCTSRQRGMSVVLEHPLHCMFQIYPSNFFLPAKTKHLKIPLDLLLPLEPRISVWKTTLPIMTTAAPPWGTEVFAWYLTTVFDHGYTCMQSFFVDVDLALFVSG